MRRFACIAAAFTTLCGAATAAPPKPDPPPGAKSWSWDKRTYTYDTTSVNRLWKMRCYVPFAGRRKCVVVGATPAGVRFLLK